MTHLMARGGFPGRRDAPRDGVPSGKRHNAPGKPPRAIKWVIIIHPWYYPYQPDPYQLVMSASSPSPPSMPSAPSE